MTYTKIVHYYPDLTDRVVCKWCESEDYSGSCCEIRDMASLLDDLAPGECPSHMVGEPGCSHCEWSDMRASHAKD